MQVLREIVIVTQEVRLAVCCLVTSPGKSGEWRRLRAL